jgi:DNA repair protein RadA/Sms
MGKCPNCEAWDQFLELSEVQQKILKESTSKREYDKIKAVSITDVEQESFIRFSTEDAELDLILGGGVVPGSLTLIGGSPGVGKSTLLLKIGSNLAKSGKKVLYVSGEESLGQIKLRADRIDANDKNLFLLSEIELENILYEIDKNGYEILIVDSIQTLYSNKITSAPGSVSQVREITFELMRLSKEREIATFIIGHITKEGSIAGPRVLEHMVDVVLYFEGDSSKDIRLLRGIKNRFGSTSEVGIFEMSKKGLISAKEISKKFFSKTKERAGSAITVIMEGSRPIILEVQALVAQSGYPTPKRSATGFELNRLNMLLALLEKRLGFEFGGFDVFVNISGGIKISETGADLAIIAAIVSSFKDRVISKRSVFIGEVSLIGDIRDVNSSDIRLNEAAAQGFERAITAKRVQSQEKIKCYEVDEVEKLLEWM